MWWRRQPLLLLSRSCRLCRANPLGSGFTSNNIIYLDLWLWTSCLKCFLQGLFFFFLSRFCCVFFFPLWSIWLSVSFCGCGFGLFASKCGLKCLCLVFRQVRGILLVEAGSCLQSGSQQSPDLWPSHSRSTTNRLRLLFFIKEPCIFHIAPSLRISLTPILSPSACCFYWWSCFLIHFSPCFGLILCWFAVDHHKYQRFSFVCSLALTNFFIGIFLLAIGCCFSALTQWAHSGLWS